MKNKQREWPGLWHISGLQRPVFFSLFVLIILITATLPFNLYDQNMQGVALYVYYMTITIAVLYLVSKNKFLSPIFIVFAVSIVLGLSREYKMLLEPIVSHRDYFEGADINLAVVKMYLLYTFSFLIVFAIYSIIPQEVGFSLEKYNITNKSNIGFTSIILFSLVGLVLIDFVYQSGGFYQAISQRSLPKEEKVAYKVGAYHILILKNSYLIPLIWCLFSSKCIKNPFFWAGLSITVLCGFLVTGSRSSLLNILIIVGFSIVFITKKFSLRKIILAFLVIFLVASYQTANRFVKHEQIQNYSLLDILQSSLEGTTKTLEDAENRGFEENSSVGLFMNIENRLDYQYGYTYYSILFIPIPSSFLSSEKPSAAGYHYVNTLTGRTNTAWPISSIAEAYWNFSYLGVVIYSLIMGLVYKVSYNTLIKNSYSPISFIIFLSVVFKFSLSSDGMYGFVQHLVVSLSIYFTYFFFSKYKFTFGKRKLF